MADKVPVKAIYTGSDVTSLGEYESSDTIAASYINGVPTGSLALAGGTMTGTLVAKVATTATDTDTSNTGNITLDFSANQNFVLTLTGNITLVNPSTEAVGQSGFIAFLQDGNRQ